MEIEINEARKNKKLIKIHDYKGNLVEVLEAPVLPEMNDELYKEMIRD